MYHLSNSKIPNVENPKSKLEKAVCAKKCFCFIMLNYIFRIFKCNFAKKQSTHYYSCSSTHSQPLIHDFQRLTFQQRLLLDSKASFQKHKRNPQMKYSSILSHLLCYFSHKIIVNTKTSEKSPNGNSVLSVLNIVTYFLMGSIC